MILIFIKFYLMMIEICKISYSRKIFVSLPLRRQSRALLTFTYSRHPLALRPCLTILFWKIFSCTEVKLPHPPRGPKSRRPLFQIQWRVFTNEHLKQGDPSS